MDSRSLKVAVYTSHGEPFSELKDLLEGLGIPFQERRDLKNYGDGLGIFYVAQVNKAEYRQLWNCAEHTGGFVEVIQ